MKEVVIVDTVRTPVGKAGWGGKKKGVFFDYSSQDMLATVFKALVKRAKERSPKFNPIMIEEAIVGCLSQIGEQGGNIARISLLIADLPQEVSGTTVNRYCNAGLSAINWAAQNIMTGCGDIFIAAGVENMSHYGMGDDVAIGIQACKDKVFSPDIGKAQLIPQGISAELCAEKYGLTREEMDRFGLWSNQKATKAWREGWFKDYVIPVTKYDGTVIKEDETYRASCLDDPEGSLTKMANLPTRFMAEKEGGKVTAGNSSQIVDAAAGVLMMSKEKAKELGFKPLATFRTLGNAGDDPRLMLLAPIPAAEKALQRSGTSIKNMDVIEPNEAFASPCLCFAKHFGYAFADERVNPTGGAIALGHPIGASGVIYFGEMIRHLERTNGRWGLQMLCGGGGCGIATTVEREDY